MFYLLQIQLMVIFMRKYSLRYHHLYPVECSPYSLRLRQDAALSLVHLIGLFLSFSPAEAYSFVRVTYTGFPLLLIRDTGIYPEHYLIVAEKVAFILYRFLQIIDELNFCSIIWMRCYLFSLIVSSRLNHG